MKLEGEVAFGHSNIGLEAESESFKSNHNDLDSATYKLQNQKVKEYDSRVSIDLKRSEVDLDLSTHNMEAVNCMTTSKLDFSNCVIDLKNDFEAQVRDFVEPVSHSSQDMESFRKFSNDIESVKRNPNSPISDPPEERDSFENSVDVYMDKSVTECEPELEVSYKESNYHVIKDICVDEGVPAKDKLLFENNVDEKAYNLFPAETYENKEMIKDKTGIHVLNLPATEESDQVSADRDQSKNLMQKDEDASKKPFDNVHKGMVLPRDKVLLQQLDTQESMPFDDDGDEIEHHYALVSSEPGSHSQPEESKNTIEEAVLASSALALAVDESDTDGMMLENGSFTYQFDPSAPAACGKEECHQVGVCECAKPQYTSKPADGKSDEQALASLVHQSLGESSFSAVGPVSSRISYSGPVPYSGSISLRSDSSTTSTRSFAFPILQSEWNSSPVRMAKADRRHYRKHRGWRQGFFCCRF